MNRMMQNRAGIGVARQYRRDGGVPTYARIPREETQNSLAESGGNSVPNTEETEGTRETDTVFCRRVPIAMAYVPMQTFTGVLEPDVALEAGTVFSELALPFTGKNPDGQERGGGCRE